MAPAQLEPLAQPQRELRVEPAPVRIGVVGTGALGRHHVRILASLPGAELVGIYDARPEVAAAAGREHGTVAFADVDALAAEVDAMVVAAPTSEHAEIGVPLLAAGIHVLVEKPIAGDAGGGRRAAGRGGAGGGDARRRPRRVLQPGGAGAARRRRGAALRRGAAARRSSRRAASTSTWCST